MLLRTSSTPGAFITSFQHKSVVVTTRALSQSDLDSSFNKNDKNSCNRNKLRVDNGDEGSHLISLDQSPETRTNNLHDLKLDLDTGTEGHNNKYIDFQCFKRTIKDDDKEDSEYNIRDGYYQALLEEDPNNPLVLSNYGEFLYKLYKYSSQGEDVKKCEELYERAILCDPRDGIILARYAEIQWDVHKDRQRATTYYNQAIQSSPDDCYIMASYASFLWNDNLEENDEQATNTMDADAPPLLISTLIPAAV